MRIKAFTNPNGLIQWNGLPDFPGAGTYSLVSEKITSDLKEFNPKSAQDQAQEKISDINPAMNSAQRFEAKQKEIERTSQELPKLEDWLKASQNPEIRKAAESRLNQTPNNGGVLSSLTDFLKGSSNTLAKPQSSQPNSVMEALMRVYSTEPGTTDRRFAVRDATGISGEEFMGKYNRIDGRAPYAKK